MSCTYFGPYLYRPPDISAEIIKQCSDEILTYHLPEDKQMRYVLIHGRGILQKVQVGKRYLFIFN